MRHKPATTILPSSLLDNSFLQSVHPTQSAPPSIAQYSAGLAHDARNMLAAMDIYCELLSTPGVLKPEHQHFLSELRLLRDSSGQLLDRLLVEALRSVSTGAVSKPQEKRRIMPVAHRGRNSDLPPGLVHQTETSREAPSTLAFTRQGSEKPVLNMVAELQAMLPMLSALAGPKVVLTLDLDSCPACGLHMPAVDFTRTLINLVRNATEAMSAGGRILIAASPVSRDSVPCILLSIEDNGPGIPLSLLDRIFETQVRTMPEESLRPRMSFRPRGLGLRIVREFVEAGQGTVRALRLPERGSRFEIVLPVVTNNSVKA